MSLTIRRAISGDAALILHYIRALAEFEKLAHEVDATEADINRDLFGDPPRVFCEIAEWEGKSVGFALWFYSFSTFRGKHGVWLEDLFVDPSVRGKGIGKALIQHLAKICDREELPRLAWSVLKWNNTAIDVYKSLGAVMQDEWTGCRVDGAALSRLAGK